jgi:hypothetical protein
MTEDFPEFESIQRFNLFRMDFYSSLHVQFEEKRNAKIEKNAENIPNDEIPNNVIPSKEMCQESSAFRIIG